MPFTVTGVVLLALDPITTPVALIAWAHAWIIPELYAARGARVLLPQQRATQDAEQRATGLLGDLVDHAARDLYAVTGLLRERGALGIWLVGEAGAILFRGRRAYCFCVRVNQPGLPAGDRVAHLLLALRADEQGFATVANMAFSGARWRVRRRLPVGQRPALDHV